MELKKIVKLVDGRIMAEGKNNRIVITSVCSTDLMSDVLRFAAKGSLLITALNQSQVIRSAEIADIPAVLVTLGKKVEKAMIELASKKEIVLISTRLPMYAVCGLLAEHGLRNCREE
jgi:predicted transcriptional regulator